MEWAYSTQDGEIRNVYKIFVGNPLESSHFEDREGDGLRY
jgi:hypothetical protein